MPNGEYGLESRVARVERDQARQDQRMSDLERRVDALTPLLTSVVALTVEFKNLREDFGDLGKKLDAFIRGSEEREENRDKRDKDAVKERVKARRWAIGLGVVLLAALIGAVAVIVSAH